MIIMINNYYQIDKYSNNSMVSNNTKIIIEINTITLISTIHHYQLPNYNLNIYHHNILTNNNNNKNNNISPSH